MEHLHCYHSIINHMANLPQWSFRELHTQPIFHTETISQIIIFCLRNLLHLWQITNPCSFYLIFIYLICFKVFIFTGIKKNILNYCEQNFSFLFYATVGTCSHFLSDSHSGYHSIYKPYCYSLIQQLSSYMIFTALSQRNSKG